MSIRTAMPAGMLSVATALLLVSPAKAAPVFDFSFVVTGGDAGSGTVTGEIFGLTDNATSAATDVVITSMPGGAPAYVPATPIDVFATLRTVGDNSFTVSNGEITSGDINVFFGADANDQFQLTPGTGDLGFPGYLQFNQPDSPIGSWSVFDANTAPVSYSAVLAPEPSSLVVVGMALLGLTMVRRRLAGNEG